MELYQGKGSVVHNQYSIKEESPYGGAAELSLLKPCHCVVQCGRTK
jgi:hypothetical protein